jgi:hypothetical protein
VLSEKKFLNETKNHNPPFKLNGIINRQISVNYDNEDSFICNIRDILRGQPFNLKGGLWFFVSFRNFFSDNTRVRIFIFFVAPTPFKLNGRSLILYDLSSITELQANLPLKISWKKLVRKEVEKLRKGSWLDPASRGHFSRKCIISSSSNLHIGHILEISNLLNLCLSFCKTSVPVIILAFIIDFLTAILVFNFIFHKGWLVPTSRCLQKDRHRFNKFDISSICPMCRLEDEDIIHFLLKCPLLAGSRQEPFRRLKNEVINNSEDGTWLRIFNNDESITTLIIDCRNYSETFMESTDIE